MNDAVGVVLAGGASRRMGRDKASLELADGISLVARAATKLAAVCATVVLADDGRGTVPGWPSVADGPGRGPAAGLLGAAERFPESRLVVLACDLPQIPEGLLAWLASTDEGEALVPRWQRGLEPLSLGSPCLEPLCAAYRPSALARLAGRVASGDFALHRWLVTVDVRYLEGEALRRFGSPEEVFLNLNRPEDLERLTSGLVSAPEAR